MRLDVYGALPEETAERVTNNEKNTQPPAVSDQPEAES